MNGINYVAEKSITLNELMRIKDICKNHLSDHYMSTLSAINRLEIKINGSTIEAYTSPLASEIRSFVKCVLSREQKPIGTHFKNWILIKSRQRKPVYHP